MNRSTHKDGTVVNHGGAFDATLDAAMGVTRGAAVDAPGPPVEMTGPRSTVLPRVERTGDGALLVNAGRPRFEMRRALGQGGIGEVVAAIDHDIGREVAIKRLRSDMQGTALVARFVDEVRTVGALEHPNIVPIHDVGVDDHGALYFVMRCLQGETLESIIEKLAAGDRAAHAHWTHERRAHVFRQLLDAVAFAHERGYVHRDIKPANVMVGQFGEVFLMDWGIAKPIGEADRPAAPAGPSAPSVTGDRVTTTHAGAIVGTPAYMSPEQASGAPVDARSDVYSLCVLFHELLCLRHYLHDVKTVEEMLEGVTHREATGPSFVPNPHQRPAPADLSWFVLKGLAKDPSRRYQSVREMIDRLDKREDGIIPIQCPVTFTKRTTRGFLRFVDRHPTLFMTGATLSILGAIALGIWRIVA